MSEETPSDNDKKRRGLSTAEELSTGHILRYRDSKMKMKARGRRTVSETKVQYFPEQYKRAMMSILIEYRDHLDLDAKSRGLRRNVGWQRIAKQIFSALEVPDADDPSKIKSLKNAIEAHENGRAIIKDQPFAYIDRFLRSLDGTDEYDAIRSKLGQEKRSYLRDAFFEMFGKRGAQDSFAAAKSLLNGHYFQNCIETPSSVVTTIVGLEFKEDSVFDVHVFTILGRVQDFVPIESTRGVFYSYGYGVVERAKQAPYADDTERYDTKQMKAEVQGTLMCSSVFDAGIGFSGLSAATFFGTQLLDQHQPRHLEQLIFFAPPTPDQRIFVSIDANAQSSQSDDWRDLMKALNEIGKKDLAVQSEYSLVRNPEVLRYLLAIKEKFDGAI